MRFVLAVKSSFPLTLLILSLSACGSGSTSPETSSVSQSPAPKAENIKSDFVFMSDFLAALNDAGVNCAGYVKEEETLFAKEEGSCTYNGVKIYPVIFGDSKTTPELVNSLKGFGGYWLTSNNWAITLDDEVTARDLQSKLGILVK